MIDLCHINFYQGHFYMHVCVGEATLQLLFVKMQATHDKYYS